jgi:hypothetical protein
VLGQDVAMTVTARLDLAIFDAADIDRVGSFYGQAAAAADPRRPGCRFWWELSMRQVEVSQTLVFDDDCHARAFFEVLLADNIDLGRPENVELISRLGRPTDPPRGGGFKTKIDRYCDLVTLNVFYKSSRCKQYLKDGRALRIERWSTTPATCAATAC